MAVNKVKLIFIATLLTMPLQALGSNDAELISYAKKNISIFVNQYSLCDRLEGLKLLDIKIGTVTKATESRKPLPAIIARADFVCVRNIEGSKTHMTNIWEVLAIDNEFNMVRCLKLSDEEDSVKEIAVECGFVPK